MPLSLRTPWATLRNEDEYVQAIRDVMASYAEDLAVKSQLQDGLKYQKEEPENPDGPELVKLLLAELPDVQTQLLRRLLVLQDLQTVKAKRNQFIINDASRKYTNFLIDRVKSDMEDMRGLPGAAAPAITAGPSNANVKKTQNPRLKGRKRKVGLVTPNSRRQQVKSREVQGSNRLSRTRRSQRVAKQDPRAPKVANLFGLPNVPQDVASRTGNLSSNKRRHRGDPRRRSRMHEAARQRSIDFWNDQVREAKANGAPETEIADLQQTAGFAFNDENNERELSSYTEAPVQGTTSHLDNDRRQQSPELGPDDRFPGQWNSLEVIGQGGQGKASIWVLYDSYGRIKDVRSAPAPFLAHMLTDSHVEDGPQRYVHFR